MVGGSSELMVSFRSVVHALGLSFRSDFRAQAQVLGKAAYTSGLKVFKTLSVLSKLQAPSGNRKF